jgi:hypothetical protein
MNGFQVETDLLISVNGFSEGYFFITGFLFAKDCACTFFNRKC